MNSYVIEYNNSKQKILVMDWHRAVAKPLSELVMTQITKGHMRHPSADSAVIPNDNCPRYLLFKVIIFMRISCQQ